MQNTDQINQTSQISQTDQTDPNLYHYFGGGENEFKVLQVVDYVSFNWKPLPDITAYELAQLVELVIRYQNGYYMDKSEYDSLDEGVRRHIPEIPKVKDVKDVK